MTNTDITGVRMEVFGQFYPVINDGTEARSRGQRHHRNEIGGRQRSWVVETGEEGLFCGCRAAQLTGRLGTELELAQGAIN